MKLSILIGWIKQFFVSEMNNENSSAQNSIGKEAIKSKQPAFDVAELFNQKLTRAVFDAHVLLDYASKSGIQVERELIEKVLTIKNAIESKDVPVELEASFWEASRKITQQVAPVTVESLKATVKGNDFNQKRQRIPPHATIMSACFLWGLVTTIFILLSFQIFSGVGLSRYESLKKKANELDVIMEQRQALFAEVYNPFSKEARNLNNHRIAKIILICDELPATRLWRITDFVQESVNGEEKETVCKRGKEPNVKMVLKDIETTLDALNSYALPLSYGLLGALAFVLRSLTAAIKNLTYTRESVINYLLRLALGAIAGLAIGWFLKPDELSAENFNMSPLALAFLAGYNVELLFSLLDKIVSSFTQSPAQQAQQNKVSAS